MQGGTAAVCLGTDHEVFFPLFNYFNVIPIPGVYEFSGKRRIPLRTNEYGVTA